MVLWFVTSGKGINPSNSFEKGKYNRAGHFEWSDRVRLNLNAQKWLWGPPDSIPAVSGGDLDVWSGWKPWGEPGSRAMGAGPQCWQWAQLTKCRAGAVGTEGPCPCPYLSVGTVTWDKDRSAWPHWVYFIFTQLFGCFFG